MSTTYAAATTSRPVLRAGLAASVIAAALTTTIAAVSVGAGVSFADRSGSAIPVGGFATLTILFSLIGVALAAGLRRRSATPRSTFVRVTVTLLVLSFLPDLFSGFSVVAATLLILAHLSAAAVVIPTLASRLPAQR